MPYYRLDWKVPESDLAFLAPFEDYSVPWTSGVLFNKPLPEPIVGKVETGTRMRDMFLVGIPLFSERLLGALTAAGAENLVTYRAEIEDLKGVVHKNYRAVNIVGTVRCADLGASVSYTNQKPPLMAFHKLVIDESKTNDLPLFRLAERSSYILVSEKVKKDIEAIQPVGMQLIPVESSG